MTTTVGKYVYHASNLPDQSAGLKSMITRGLQPSRDGYAGPGVYFAYDAEGGFYHVGKEEATMFRVKWADLMTKFGVYPENENGIQRDENEIIVPAAVPADMLEVEYFPGEWWDLKSAYHASLGPVNEAKIDNRAGRGAVPYNQEVDYFGLRVQMKPSTFLSLAAPLNEKDNSEMEEYIRSGGAIGAPFLDIAIPKEWDDGDFTAVAKIQGHEGRHRMRAIMAVEGDNPIEVHLFPKYYRARDLTPEFVRHINAGLYAEKSSRIVRGPLFTASAVSEASLGDMRSWFAGRTPAKKPITRSADMRAYFNQEQPVPTTQTKKSTDNFSKLDVPNNIKMTLWKVQNKRQLSRNEYMDLKMWNDRRKLVGEAGPIKLTQPDTKVTDFIEAVYTKYPQQFQNNHVMPMGGEGDDQQFAMFELTPSFSRRGAVEVKWFQAYPLRQGVGSRAMQELQAMAKDAGIALTLFPWDKGQVSQAKLTKFYKSQGFKPTVKGAKNMAWTPESLDEAFDQPYPMSWEKSEADDSMDALARLPDGSNLSIMFNMEYDEEGEEVIQVEFHRNNSQEVTGDGDAQRVFATVLAAIQQYIKTHKPKRLTFSASKEVEPDQNSESRAKLYDRLVIRYARTWGYRPLRADTGTIVRYELSRVKPVTEAFDQPRGIDWEQSEESEAVDAIARLSDGTPLTVMFEPEAWTNDSATDWSVSFWRGNSQEVTGAGNAQEVFATVLSAIRQFVHSHQPESIEFSASKEPEVDMAQPGANVNPESRAKLYDRMVDRYAGAMGYQVRQQQGNNKVTYTLKRTKQGVAEGERNDTAISLSRLGKFHPGADTLAEFVPERATAQYALHPDKWESTFYSLTNKDSDKLKYYGPKKISIPPGTLVGDMAIANKFYRAKTQEEKQQYAELYKASLQPYPVNVSKYRMPELLMPKQGVAEGKIKLYTDPGYFGAEVDDAGFDSLPVVNISADRLVGFEPDSKMNQPKSQANVKKIVAGLKKGDKLPPLLVRKYKNGYQVLDGHHRFWAYKLSGTKSIPVRIVADKDIEEISKSGVAEAETGTAHADQIEKEFTALGYKLIGSGADSTVWAKNKGHIIKILMPEAGGQAEQVFTKFYEFCLAHQDLECLPVINEHNKINVLDREYTQIDMERLSHIKKNSFNEGVVWFFSDFVAGGESWGAVDHALGLADTWTEYNPRQAANLAKYWQDMTFADDNSKYKELHTLYGVMQILYKAGRINKFGWDLHTDNVMQRKNGQLVIIDPWFADSALTESVQLPEARTNPEQNTRPASGMKELQAVAKTLGDIKNWAISMTAEPKLGINPQVGISEDTPKGIYFYPLDYALGLIQRRQPLPWGDKLPYIQLFQYDRSKEMTKGTQVDSVKLKQAVGQYCSEEVIQSAIDEPEYDGTPYWFIYDCLSRLGKSDETNIVRWNKVLRDLGFTSVYDDGHGWIAYNEPTQGVVLDPRIIKQLRTIDNKKESGVITPALIEQTLFDNLDVELAGSRAWQAYDPDGSKLKQLCKEWAQSDDFKPWFGKDASALWDEDQKLMGLIGYYRRTVGREINNQAWEWYRAQQAQKTESFTPLQLAVMEGGHELDNVVTDLEQDLENPHSYDAVDHMMQTIAKEHGITAKQLHDMFVDKHGQVPDEWVNTLAENFADGKNPQDKGDSQRHGIPKGATMDELEKASKASGRKGQLARWQLNMRRGRKKATEGIIAEGGWASAATQDTVITPAIIVEVVAGLNEFAKEYNTWQAQSELGLEIKMGKPKGSGTYYERDLKQDPTREYGDIDIECFIHSRPGASSAQLITQYKNAIAEFTRHNRDFASDNGTNIIMTTSAGPAQVDLIYTFNEHADWSRALSPEYRVKGVISTSLTSALAEVLNFSFSSQGVQVKTRAGRPVSFRQSKDTELTTVTTNPDSWARDMFQYYYTLANGQPYADRLLDLDQHPGLKDEQRLADIVHSIRSLATELERNNLLGNGALDHVADAQTLLTQVSKIYAQKLEAVISSSKFDKAATPAAEEKAKKTKLMLAKYRNEVAKLLLN